MKQSNIVSKLIRKYSSDSDFTDFFLSLSLEKRVCLNSHSFDAVVLVQCCGVVYTIGVGRLSFLFMLVRCIGVNGNALGSWVYYIKPCIITILCSCLFCNIDIALFMSYFPSHSFIIFIEQCINSINIVEY